jgi:hypothetical protein
MSEQAYTGADTHRYAIRIEEGLDARWSDWFDGMTVTEAGDGTVLEGMVVDQSALHGLLAKLRDLNLSVVSVQRLSPAMSDDATPA